MMQEVIVTIMIAWSAYIVGRRYVPRILRFKLNALLARIAKQSGWHKMAAHFELKVIKSNACANDGCGACGGCKANNHPQAEKQIIITSRISK